MKKFIIAVFVVLSFIAVANKMGAELHERNMRSIERSIAVNRLAEGRAPMQYECEAIGGMVFRVDTETGVTRCKGVAGGLKMKFSAMLQAEASVMGIFDDACRRDDGIMIVEKTLHSDNATVLACTESKFAKNWTSK